MPIYLWIVWTGREELLHSSLRQCAGPDVGMMVSSLEPNSGRRYVALSGGVLGEVAVASLLDAFNREELANGTSAGRLNSFPPLSAMATLRQVPAGR